MMSHETLEPPLAASEPSGLDGKASIENLKKIWGAFRQQNSPDSGFDDISAAQTTLYCSHFLSTWGQVGWVKYLQVGPQAYIC